MHASVWYLAGGVVVSALVQSFALGALVETLRRRSGIDPAAEPGMNRRRPGPGRPGRGGCTVSETGRPGSGALQEARLTT
ncbi:SCO4225 family membrane protein [Streptomyces sp. NPDC002690]